MNRKDFEALADELRDLADDLDTKGHLTFTRTADWQKRTIEGLHVLTEGEDPEQPYETGPERTEAERRALKQINSFHPQYVAAIRALRTHTRTATRIITEANPPQVATKPDTPAQVALDGYCRSCWRNDGELRDVAKPKYRDLCRRCGEWAASHDGKHPPLAVLEIWHSGPGKGGRVSEQEYRRIMGRKPA